MCISSLRSRNVKLSYHFFIELVKKINIYFIWNSYFGLFNLIHDVTTLYYSKKHIKLGCHPMVENWSVNKYPMLI